MILVLALIHSLALAAEPESFVGDTPHACTPRTGQPCFTVRGRLVTGFNGNPSTRLWVVGTKRILGIPDGYELPKSVQESLGVNSDDPVGKHVFGDYTFCPFTPDEPGVMRRGCIKEAVNLRVE